MPTDSTADKPTGFVRKWRGEQPVRRILRKWSVGTILATAGLLLSIAALLIVVGIGQVQIDLAARPDARPANLFSDGWFLAGAIVGIVGIGWGVAAIAAMASQSRALRAFPALKIELIGGGFNPQRLPHGVTTADPWFSQQVNLRITNREITRRADLDVRMRCRLTPGFGDERELRLPPAWQEDYLLGGSLQQLRPPIALEPQTTTEGFVVFDFANVSPHLTEDRQLELVDHNSGRAIAISTESGLVLNTAR
jgi:hypothetical protein